MRNGFMYKYENTPEFHQMKETLPRKSKVSTVLSLLI